jgi:hypothetical protein
MGGSRNTAPQEHACERNVIHIPTLARGRSFRGALRMERFLGNLPILKPHLPLEGFN